MTQPRRSFLETLRARARSNPRRIVFVEADDARTLDAVAELVRGGLVEPWLVATEDPSERLRQQRVDPGRVHIVDPSTDVERYSRELTPLLRPDRSRADTRMAASDPLVRGALMLRLGEVDGAVAGAVHPTAAVLRVAMRTVGLADHFHTLSSSFYMVLPESTGTLERVLTFSDPGVVPEPTPDQLAEIAHAAAEARRHVVGDEPRVAFLSYSTLGSAGGDPVLRIREALRLFRRRAPHILADGELQADAALVEAVASKKAPESPVAGRANVLVFPNLDAANIGYKLVQRLAGAVALGPVLQGLKRPLNDLSRGATARDIVEVACITALMVDPPDARLT